VSHKSVVPAADVQLASWCPNHYITGVTG